MFHNQPTPPQEMIGFIDQQIHDGKFYFIKGAVDIDGIGTVTDFMFTTPEDVEVHARASINCEAEFLVQIYEDVTTSDDGTPVTPFNANRLSDNTPGLSPFASPTITDTGTLIWESKIGAGRSAGVSPSFGYEIIAKKSTKYLWRLTKSVAGIHYVDYDFFWHES